MAFGHPFGAVAGGVMGLVVALGMVWVACPWWTCALRGPPVEHASVSLWQEVMTSEDGEETASVSVKELCRKRESWDHFCGRVQAIRVLAILAVLAAAASSGCMLVAFCGVRRFHEGVLLKDGAHLAGACFILLLVAAALAEYIGTIRLYPIDGHPSGATKVYTNGLGFACALVGMPLTVPSGIAASLAGCRLQQKAAPPPGGSPDNPTSGPTDPASAA